MLPSTAIALYNAKAPFDQAVPGGLGFDLHKTKNVLKAVWSFAVNGGAIGTMLLFDDQGNPALLPAKAIVQRCYVDCFVAFVGATATIAYNSEAAGDLLAATAVASMTGLVEGVPTGTAATMKKTTVQRQIGMTVAVAPLTAGQANVFIEYILSN
jgi:hypothetical protein